MMPFGKTPKGYPQSGEGDQKNVIKQMKVRTTIKGDDSWIHKPDDTEGQTIVLPPSEEPSSAAPPLITPRKERPPAPKPSSGYIIRGVFTKPIDSTSLPQNRYSATSEPPERSVVPAKPTTANLPQLSASGYKVSSDDYKKETPSRAEASCHLFQRSATWEHSYVLSAAKKSSQSSTQDLAPPFMAKRGTRTELSSTGSSEQPLSRPRGSIFALLPERVEVEEGEVPPERIQTLPSLARQIFGFTSGKKEETHTLVRHDPKLEYTLRDFSPDTSGKRAFLAYKERNISSTREDIPREEEEKDLYPDVNRSSTWSTDSNHGSSGSQNDLDEIEITSKKKSTLSYGDRYISSTQSYKGPGNQQPVEANKPRSLNLQSEESDILEMPLLPLVPREYRIPYWNLIRPGSEECGVFSPDDQYDRSMNVQSCRPRKNTTTYVSASTVSTTEKRYGSSAGSDDPMPSEPRRFASSSRSSTDQKFGTLPIVDDMTTSDHRSSLSGYEERSITTIVREARWDSIGFAGAKGGTHPDPNIYSSDNRVITPDSAHQLQGSSQEFSSRRCVSATGERASMGAASAQDSASALDSEQSSKKSSKISGVTCTYCLKEIRSGPKIILEHLGICCHESCFKCGICKRKMGNILERVFIHKGIIHCDQCYTRLF
ncbi:zinc finger protein 185 [Vombatus ursinus]|uniref:zinc finger protein 185 n=1 Tax=Vombatus ursinus TaxID=29139 RepID=UPI000FFCFCC8|nr:zinc finger protein 185 [Vombatus ursinus]